MSVRGFVLAGVVSLAGLAGAGVGVSPASAAIGHAYESQITGVSPSEPFGEQWGLAFDGSGSLFVADARQEAVDVFDASNAFVPPQLTSTALREHYTRGVAVGASGVVYVAESGPETIDVFEPESGNKYKLLQETKFGGYVFTAVDNHPVEPSDPRAGDVYVLNSGLHVVKVDAQGRLEGTGEEIPGPPGGFSLGGSGAGLAVDAANGNVYVANPSEKKVDVFDDHGTEQSLLELSGAETPQGAGAFSPNAVAIDNINSVVYVVDQAAKIVDEFSKTGTYLRQIVGQGTPAEMFVAPVAVAVQEHAGPTQGEVYVSDSGGKVVDVFGPAVALADVATGSAVGVGSASVTLNGSVNPEGIAVSECKFEYRTSEEATFTHSVACSQAPGSGSSTVAVSANLTGLTPDRTYHYRLMARNANGANYGVGETFTTLTAVHSVSTGPVEDIKATNAKLTGSLSPDGEDAHYYFEYGPTTSYGSSVPLPPGTDAGSGGPGCVPPGGGSCAPVAASATVGALETDTTYHYRIVAADSLGTTYGQDEVFTTLGPALRDESVSNVAATSATLEATINSNGASTAYYFQYSTSSTTDCQASPSSCTDLPTQPESLGAGTQDVSVSHHIQGLTPANVYHYRVIALSEPVPGEPLTVYGEDRTLTTQTSGDEFALPDGRQWEMVSPANKQGSAVEPMSQFGGVIEASEDGRAITYIADGPTEANPQGNRASEFAQVLSKRGASEWQSEDITTLNSMVSEVGVGSKAEYKMFTDDLSLGVVAPKASTAIPPLREGAEKTIYSRNDSNATFTALVTENNILPSAHVGGFEFGGASPDLTHIVLSSPEAWTPNAVSGEGNSNLYEWVGGNLQLASVLQDGKAAQIARLGYDDGLVRNAVSTDGTRIVWESFPPQSSQGHLFLRDISKKITVQIDEVQGGSGEGKQEPEFQGASSDDSRVFFTDRQQLTPDAQAGDRELYVFDLTTDRLTDLTADSNERKGVREETQFEGAVIGYSENGASVYFVANGALASGASQKSPGFNCGATCNLYLAHSNGATWETRFIASLSNADDSPVWNPGGIESDLAGISARVSPNGRYLSFMSSQRLTHYDNRDVNSGVPDEEVYLYDADTGKLVCASCNPTGMRPAGVRDTGFRNEGVVHGLPLLADSAQIWQLGRSNTDNWLAGNVPGWKTSDVTHAYYQPRYLSDNGRLFFNSADALVPGDVNGKEDVYEYQPETGGCGDGLSSSALVFKEEAGGSGCVGLISSGASSEESAFLDASASGDDVFFLTSSQLVPGDVDSALDVYDAHVCSSGLPCPGSVVASPPCTNTDSCRVAPAPQPSIFGAPASATFVGHGNATSGTVMSSSRAKGLTVRQRLARALRACRRDRRAKRRTVCEAKARHVYRAGTTAHHISSRRGGR